MTYEFDCHLRYDELVEWLQQMVERAPQLVTLDTYGTSHEGRELWLVTVTDTSTGPHDSKPAHWVDASIHAEELTATVAACYLIERLVAGFEQGDSTVLRALQTRTFYVVPRVNPDGAEWALADRPRIRRSSARAWPWTDGHQWPGLHVEDVDGDGRVLSIRIADPHGAWMPHPDDQRLMIPVPPTGAVSDVPTYRILREGVIADHDGYTTPTPSQVEALDLNRNFPAGWGTGVPGSGDHPLSEPEVDALVRAIVARPNICGYNAFHTSGGVLLRPSSTTPDSELEPNDVWMWEQIGASGTELTGYPVHSVFEDFTWDNRDTMSGAADDWVYEHLGVFGWTTEFWDIVEQATGSKQSTHHWYIGPTDEQALAVLRWCDEHHPASHVDWYPFDHPQLGSVELGGWDTLTAWTNPPPHMLREEVAPHADFAIHQVLCAPQLEIAGVRVSALGDGHWQVDVGVVNSGWLATDVSAFARHQKLVKPAFAELAGDGVAVVGGPVRQMFGPLDGRAAARFRHRIDGVADQALLRWIVAGEHGASATVTVISDRTGRVSAPVVLA